MLGLWKIFENLSGSADLFLTMKKFHADVTKHRTEIDDAVKYSLEISEFLVVR
jgi:hypothetical protein